MSFFGVPTCRSCIQRIAGGAQQQIRHKSKMVKVATIPVRLLQDIPKLGRRGQIIPVPRGRMRDSLYPFKLAEYMTAAMLRSAPKSEILSSVDSTFRPVKEEKVAVKISLPKPVASISMLEDFMPPKIMFSRPTIAPGDNTIHGSITTNDICIAVRSIAAANGDEASKLVITPDMITFLDKEVESDRVKTLGEHKFEIRLKGAVKPVQRKLVISQQVSLD
ncbi:hypothetical protein BZA77DRAFT_71170 [Pyronema omphalodes]|nr:hypothetical protein BZA77DRAFT_71170 [Pyronema omphalodes]